MFSLSSLPTDVIRYIITFIPIQSMRWSRALSLQSIKDNGGLESVILDYIPPSRDVLNSIIGSRTRFLNFNFNVEKLGFLQSLNTSELKILKIRDCTNWGKNLEARLKEHPFEPLQMMQLSNLKELTLDYIETPFKIPENVKLETLNLNHFYGESLDFLRDIFRDLKHLTLDYFPYLLSLEPLSEMRPESLEIRNFPKVSQRVLEKLFESK